jgi:hypothetical protein
MSNLIWFNLLLHAQHNNYITKVNNIFASFKVSQNIKQSKTKFKYHTDHSRLRELNPNHNKGVLRP